MEQLVTLITDTERHKAQMAAILAGFAEALRIERQKNWGGRRRAKDAAAVELAPATATPLPAKRGPRGPYRKSPTLAASTALNGRLRHLERTDPLRVKVEAIRASKGHVAALAYFNAKLPIGTKNIRQTRLALAAKRSQKTKPQRADNALRSAFVAAVRNLSEADKAKAVIQKRKHGTQAALRWIEERKTTETKTEE